MCGNRLKSGAECLSAPSADPGGHPQWNGSGPQPAGSENRRTRNRTQSGLMEQVINAFTRLRAEIKGPVDKSWTSDQPFFWLFGISCGLNTD